jgi:hypothetical protein
MDFPAPCQRPCYPEINEGFSLALIHGPFIIHRLPLPTKQSLCSMQQGFLAGILATLIRVMQAPNLPTWKRSTSDQEVTPPEIRTS